MLAAAAGFPPMSLPSSNAPGAAAALQQHMFHAAAQEAEMIRQHQFIVHAAAQAQAAQGQGHPPPN